jgi:exosortase/archaeosortase family protein
MALTIANYIKYWQDIPSTVRSFLLKALVCFVIWKIAYHLYIMPNRLLYVPLTIQVTAHAKQLLSLVYPQKHFTITEVAVNNNSDFFGISIFSNGKKVITLLDACNGLELYIIYISFIVCLPSNLKRMLLFISLGTIGIYMLNVIRCVVLGVLNINRSLYVDFAHHYLFTMVVYIAIFIGWAFYINKRIYNEAAY